MITPQPDLRLELGDIICHPWMQGTKATSEQLVEEMERRQQQQMEMAEQVRVNREEYEARDRVMLKMRSS